jgi:HNH endonuclease
MTDCKSNLDFCQEIECTYKDERYSARDNGAVLRHPRDSNRPRPTDNNWTFGKPNRKTGYMEIATARVHRIVATAFHGKPPTKEHVVDHIDTNKRNNRPENLRWVTRLENVLLNPITAKRIMLTCGSIEAFLADPSKFRDKFQEPNYNWMCTVSIQEAQTSLERLLAWAKSDKLPSGGTLGKWIFDRSTSQKQDKETIPDFPDFPDLIKAKTINAAQRDWRTPSEFPCCPQTFTNEPLSDYAKNLITGSIFCRNDIYSNLVSKRAISNDRQSIYVISVSTEIEDTIKPWGLAKITYENGMFIHTSLHNFFTPEGAEKQYSLAQGIEWTGGDSIDDYC